MNTLGGFVVVRNGASLDYCWREAAESLLPYVQELIICDSDSTDGTTQAIQRWADKQAGVKYVNFPWTDPVRTSHHWFIEWLNFAKNKLSTSHFVYLDADEVLSDSRSCIAAMRDALADGKPRLMDRLNFWRDASSLIPEGECCGKRVSRFGPVAYEACSDEPHHEGERPILDEAIYDERLKVFHLGFLREQKAFYRKARAVLNQWFGRFDPRLEKAEKEDKPVWESECEWADKLVPWSGYMPAPVQKWLAARGHWTPDFVPLFPHEEMPAIEAPNILPSNNREPINILHTGDLGDIVHMLAIAQALGKVRIYLRDWWGTKPLLSRKHLILPLLQSQSYVLEAKAHEGESIHWPAWDFRKHHMMTQSLAVAHHLHFKGMNIQNCRLDLHRPWIVGIKPDERARGKVIVNKTWRYPNEWFSWRDVVAFYGEAVLFIGTPSEHERFCHEAGQVAYQPTANLLEVAQLLAACHLFIGEQSACLAVAEGMKVQRIAEISIQQPDVVVALDETVQYVCDGAMILPSLDGGQNKQILPALNGQMPEINTAICPNGGWQWEGRTLSTGFYQATQLLKIQTGWNEVEAAAKLKEYNIRRLPNYFCNHHAKSQMHLFQQAVENAKVATLS